MKGYFWGTGIFTVRSREATTGKGVTVNACSERSESFKPVILTDITAKAAEKQLLRGLHALRYFPKGKREQAARYVSCLTAHGGRGHRARVKKFFSQGLYISIKNAPLYK